MPEVSRYESCVALEAPLNIFKAVVSSGDFFISNSQLACKKSEKPCFVMSSTRSARSSTSRGFVDAARVSSTTVNTVLGVFSRDRPRSQVMYMALPVENTHFSHHKRTCVSLCVWQLMFLPATSGVRVFSAMQTPKTRRPASRRRNCYSLLKEPLALAGAKRDGVFLLAHTKSLNAVSNVAGFTCSIVFSIESRPEIDGSPRLSAPLLPPPNAVASPEGPPTPLSFPLAGRPRNRRLLSRHSQRRRLDHPWENLRQLHLSRDRMKSSHHRRLNHMLDYAFE